jgi:hypothetical protein
MKGIAYNGPKIQIFFNTMSLLGVNNSKALGRYSGDDLRARRLAADMLRLYIR